MGSAGCGVQCVQEQQGWWCLRGDVQWGAIGSDQPSKPVQGEQAARNGLPAPGLGLPANPRMESPSFILAEQWQGAGRCDLQIFLAGSFLGSGNLE